MVFYLLFSHCSMRLGCKLTCIYSNLDRFWCMSEIIILQNNQTRWNDHKRQEWHNISFPGLKYYFHKMQKLEEDNNHWKDKEMALCTSFTENKTISTFLEQTKQHKRILILFGIMSHSHCSELLHIKLMTHKMKMTQDKQWYWSCFD